MSDTRADGAGWLEVQITVIISDVHKMAFVHIPKCAGTSIRRQLTPYDSYDGFFWDFRMVSPDGPVVDHAHLTLNEVAEFYPEAYRKLLEYETYALVRDPVDRFWSGVAERARLLRNYDSKPAITDIFEQAEIALEGHRPWERDASFVHLSPQWSYLYRDGAPIVKHVFIVEETNRLLADFSFRCGMNLDSQNRENSRHRFLRHQIGNAERVRNLIESTGGTPWRRAARKIVRPLLLLESVPVHAGLTERIIETYKKDLLIYSAVRNTGSLPPFA